ncbi:MAG: hypothetical protein GY944_22300 [bacterium]|nr:hypothetical protein [bacterium]
MVKKKVFVSFDFDRDVTLRDFIVGQAKNADSPFSISDYSIKEAKPEKDWEAKARAAIARSDVFFVMLGSRTRFASGVKKEVAMANQLLASGQIESRSRSSATGMVRRAGVSRTPEPSTGGAGRI